MKWQYYRRTRNCASLSCAADYVISHRRQQHVVSYRPPGQHIHVGQYQTWQAAKAAAEQHAKGPNHGAATHAKAV